MVRHTLHVTRENMLGGRSLMWRARTKAPGAAWEHLNLPSPRRDLSFLDTLPRDQRQHPRTSMATWWWVDAFWKYTAVIP